MAAPAQNVYQPKDLPHGLSYGDIEHRGSLSALSAGEQFGLDEAKLITQALAAVANQAIFRVYRAPYSGYLRNISYFVGTASGAATTELGVWDAGEAAAGSYTNLAVSTGRTSAASGGWETLWDPAVPVVAGQHFLIHLASSATVLNYGAMPSLQGANIADLNAIQGRVTSGGNKLKIAASKSSVYGSTTAIVEANMAVQVKLPVFTFQILKNPTGSV